MQFPVRKSARIPNYDYGMDNYYFVTICTHEKKCLFGSAKKISCYGKIAADAIENIEKHYTGVTVDKFVVMPNHIHMIIIIGCDTQIKQNVNLNHVIGLYKSGVSREIHKHEPDIKVWQRYYHDHVIRGKSDYEKIWDYIQNNPLKWEEDCFYRKESKT